MPINLNTIKKVLTTLTCIIHKPKWVGQSWVRINSKQFQIQTKYVCTRCGKAIFKPIGE